MFLILAAMLMNISAGAQVGMADIGKTNIGHDSLYTANMGRSQTPACSWPGPCNARCPIYTFTGAGNWNIPGNWAGNMIPPVVLGGCRQIVINPVGDNECILNIPYQVMQPGTSITVMNNKKFRIPGSIR
jgi:hypothetical protein